VQRGAKAKEAPAGSLHREAGRSIGAGRVVSAVPGHRLRSLFNDELRASDARFHQVARLEASPIIGGNLRFSAPVLDVYAASLVHAQTHWVFQARRDPSRVHCVISAADTHIRSKPDDLAAMMELECRAYLRIPDRVRLESARVVKEPFATITPAPGADAFRPATTGPSGVILAGCYTDTGWPSTMEGAARSGYAAADAALGNPPGTSSAPSRRPEPLARVLSASASASA